MYVERVERVVLFVLMVLFSGLAPASAATGGVGEGIVAVVNEDAISASDLNDRLRLMIISSGMPNTPEIQDKLKNQVLNMLIDESLQMQEARQMNLAVTAEEIQTGFDTIAKQNNMPPDQFKTILQRSGIPIRTLEGQIRSQIAWGKVIQRKLRPQIEVSEGDIDERERFLEASIGKTQYQVAEIFLPVDSNTQDAEVKALAQRLYNEIAQKRAPFPQVANQFSQGAAAARGGDLGWVPEGQLPDPLNALVVNMAEGGVSEPARSLTGYHILMLRGKRSVAAENIPDREQILQQVGTERLDRAQRRYLMDLKAEAFVERRV